MVYPSPDQIAAIHMARNVAIGQLRSKPSICLDDLSALDRCGRFTVAAELWAQCSNQVKDALLVDAHHFVRSTAILSKD